MKLRIRNILQNIINKIESEEDKTLPEDYFKGIIIELQQLSKWQLNNYDNKRRSAKTTFR